MSVNHRCMQIIGGGRGINPFVGLETTSDAEFWVDSATGNDGNNGTQAAPFQTIERALQAYPPGMVIRHKIKFNLSGAFTSFPDTLHYSVSTTGSITFDGSNAAGSYSPVSGPHTISAVTGIGPLGTLFINIANDISVAGTPWTPNEFRGKFIRFLTGGGAGKWMGIHSNTSSALRVGANWAFATATNTFEIVEPQVTITLDKDVSIFNLSGFAENDESAFNFVAVDLKSNSKKMTCKYANLVCSGSKFSDFAENDLVFQFSVLNGDSVDSGDFNDSDLEASLTYATVFDRTIDGLWDFWAIDCALFNFTCFNFATSLDGSNATIFFSLVGGIDCKSPSGNTLFYIYINQQGFNKVCLLDDDSSLIFVQNVWIESGGRPLESTGKRLRLIWFKGNSSTAYAAKFGEGTRIQVEVPADVTIVGSSGAFEFFITGSTPAATWPTVPGTVVSSADGTKVYVL